MTSDPNPETAGDLAAHNVIAALRRDVPVVKDIKDYAIPEFFETDEEFADFQRWLEAERQPDLT